MADPARKWTDAQLAEMERHIRQIYEQAKSELTEKWDAYMKRGKTRLEKLFADYMAAPADKKAQALEKYQNALRNFTLRNQWYGEMVAQTAYRLARVNEIALAYVNGRIPSIYARNFNQVDPDALLIKPNWTIRNEYMVRNLLLNSLPQKTLNYAKDMAWNTQQINSSVLQGVLQGESIDKMSKRLLPIVKNNRVAAVRAARTMVTGAENKGRFDRYHDYESAGVVMTKVWIATPDGRTRAWHLSMDGQEVGVDEPFIDGHGHELQYPGDPSAPPDSIYNCRCSMRSHIMGVRGPSGKVTPIKNYRTEQSFHEQQIATEKERRGNA